jgi:hypothetical protein
VDTASNDPNPLRAASRATAAAICVASTLLASAALLGAPAAAQARIPLPPSYSYVALDGAVAVAQPWPDCTDGCEVTFAQVPLDGSPPATLASMSLTGVDCPDGDPNYYADSLTGLLAANEGRALVFDTRSGCGSPRTGQWYAGPYAGPLQPLAFPACADDATVFAISERYAARACPNGSSTDVAVASTDGAVARSYRFPTPDRLSLALAGSYLATVRESSGDAHVSVTNLDSGAASYSFTAPAPLVYALGDDGTVVAGSGAARSPCPLSGLNSYSPSAPTAHGLPYSVCGPLYLRDGKLVFEQPDDGFTDVRSGDLSGSPAQTLTTFSHFGELIDTDGSRVLASDSDCQRDPNVAYVAPGGGADNPGPHKCPLAFGARQARATFDTLGNELDVRLPLSCPSGCFISTYSIVRHGRTQLSTPGSGKGSFLAEVSTENRGVARACLRYRAALADYKRAIRHGIKAAKPPAPTVDAKVVGINRDGTTTTRTESLRLELRFTHD